ncbi:AMP-binding protein, partial [Dokdonella soli]|uniref:AMP-binding protein n=1 Tax=Dokdonella soli TaxID=529810 RepID=UPI003622EAD5
AAWASHPADNPTRSEVDLLPTHLAYVIYTSGSTGLPKGVMVDHKNLTHSNFARVSYYETFGRLLLLSPLSFDSSVAGVFATLTNNGMLIIAPERIVRDPIGINDAIKDHQIQTLICIPSLYLQIIEASVNRESLLKVIVSGEACTPHLVKTSAQIEPQTIVFNEYGPTEGTVWASVYRCNNQPQTQAVPIGRPIWNTQIYLLDRYGQPVPVGVAGELYIGGAGVARGY